LILRVATETGGRGWVGAALDANSVGEVVGEALQPLTTGDYTVALRDGGGRSLWASEPGAAGMSLVNPLRAVAGWELAFGAPVPPDAVVRRRSLSYALVGLLASMLVAGLWVTARGRAQELALAKRQADFVAAVSHELKSPLTSIRLYTERLSSGRATATEAREYFATVDSEAGRLERLVNRLLVSQRMQEGRHAYVFKPGSLADVARTAIARLQAQARARRVTLELRETGSTATTFDCAAITDAIENLAENAIKYSPEHSSVVVSIASGGEHVSVEVADCGVGIDEADLPHIFEKFFRGRRGDRADVRGTGLGLSLVKAIVDAHDGAIEVTSVPGEGSRFVVRLPRRTASAPGVAV
jgi:signal transduction histidine kinase